MTALPKEIEKAIGSLKLAAFDVAVANDYDEQDRAEAALVAAITRALSAAEERGAEAQRRACAEHVASKMYGAIGAVAVHWVNDAPRTYRPSAPGEEERR